jgi:hypothetical protein
VSPKVVIVALVAATESLLQSAFRPHRTTFADQVFWRLPRQVGKLDQGADRSDSGTEQRSKPDRQGKNAGIIHAQII